MLPKIILASSSPRRKQLLEWAEINFEIITQPTAETIPQNVLAEQAPIHIAREKALAVQQKIKRWSATHSSEHLSYPILAADTIVLLDNEILGKPENEQDAQAMLGKLQGRQHAVVTGVVILIGEFEIAFSQTTLVTFHPLSASQISFYIKKYKPYDKAGAYAIQEWIGVVGIKEISGDFYNVMGLPVSRVVMELRQYFEGINTR